MRLRTYNYEITATLQPQNSTVQLKSTFIIKARSVNRDQAIQIAKILYPDTDIIDVAFKV